MPTRPNAARPLDTRDHEPQIATAFRALAKILAPFIADEIGTRPANDVENWIDQCRSPLGRRLHCALARDGRLEARKVGRRWLVRRADVDAFIALHGKRPAMIAPPDVPAQDDRVRALLAECGADLCRPLPAPARRKARS